MSIVFSLAFASPATSVSKLNAPSTCADLATNDTYGLSFEGSWSYRTLDPQHAPLSTGKNERTFIRTFIAKPFVQLAHNVLAWMKSACALLCLHSACVVCTQAYVTKSTHWSLYMCVRRRGRLQRVLGLEPPRRALGESTLVGNHICQNR